MGPILEGGITLVHPYSGKKLTKRTRFNFLVVFEMEQLMKHGETEVTSALLLAYSLFSTGKITCKTKDI